MKIWKFPHNLLDYKHAVINSRSSSGQALAEIIFALAMASFLITGMIVAMRAGLVNSQYSQHKIQSAHFAQEAIEMARAERDKNGYSSVVSDCCGHTDPNFIEWEDGSGTNDSIFVRTVDVTDLGGGVKRITVTVSWDEFGETVETRLTTQLTDHK